MEMEELKKKLEKSIDRYFDNYWITGANPEAREGTKMMMKIDCIVIESSSAWYNPIGKSVNTRSLLKKYDLGAEFE